MKTFRFIGMALLAVVMSVNFTSCSDDEEEPSKNDDGVITNQKLLIELRMTNEDGVSITEYSYGSNGKLISATNTEHTMVAHTPVLIQSLGEQTKSLKAEMERQSHIH